MVTQFGCMMVPSQINTTTTTTTTKPFPTKFGRHINAHSKILNSPNYMVWFTI